MLIILSDTVTELCEPFLSISLTCAYVHTLLCCHGICNTHVLLLQVVREFLINFLIVLWGSANKQCLYSFI